MNVQEFTPKYFISVGLTAAYYTLRVTDYRFDSKGNAYPVSFHIQNLAQDAQEAFDKAQEFSKQNAIPLYTSLEDMVQEMREIKRTSAEKLAERAAKIKADEELHKQWELERAERFQSALNNGIYPMGAFNNKPFREASRSYITWLVTSINEFDTDSDIKKMAEAAKASCSDLVLPIPDKTATIGNIGKRQNFEVEIIRVGGFQTMYGWTNVITMVEKESKACLVSKGTFYGDVGESLNIKATVKEFSEYKGQQQTVVQRVAVQ